MFHGRTPYDVREHELVINLKKNFLPTTDFPGDLHQGTKGLIDKTKKQKCSPT